MESTGQISKEEAAQNISTLWGILTPKQHDLLLQSLAIKTFRRNEMVYKNLESPTHIMCLVEGKVKVFKEGVSGKSQIIRVIKPNEFFAYRAYFASENYRTSAMCMENSTIVSFPIKTLVTLMEQNFNVSLFFIKYLCYEIGKSDDRTVNLTQKHIRGRLAEAILFLKDSYGMESDGMTLDISMSREDLANLSNMTTSNAIRTLSSFASEKLITLEGKKIRILDENELRNISALG